jgi:hypothetical protein
VCGNPCLSGAFPQKAVRFQGLGDSERGLKMRDMQCGLRRVHTSLGSKSTEDCVGKVSFGCLKFTTRGVSTLQEPTVLARARWLT